MKSWTYLISIPVGIAGTILFWYYLIQTVNSGAFDSMVAWILLGVAVHGFLIGVSYHAYRTLTGTWLKSTRGKTFWEKFKERRNKK